MLADDVPHRAGNQFLIPLLDLTGQDRHPLRGWESVPNPPARLAAEGDAGSGELGISS